MKAATRGCRPHMHLTLLGATAAIALTFGTIAPLRPAQAEFIVDFPIGPTAGDTTAVTSQEDNITIGSFTPPIYYEFYYPGGVPTLVIDGSFSDTSADDAYYLALYAANGSFVDDTPFSTTTNASLYTYTASLSEPSLAVGDYDVGITYLSSFGAADPPSGDVTFNIPIEPPTATPLPAAFPLLAGGLGMIGRLGWRRKRKGAAAA